ncbi:MAG: SAM-dependent methyltransferase [Myxococcales bacterium]|nr:SAM-dependent methyltransferase [Myxococcales bacterium]
MEWLFVGLVLVVVVWVVLDSLRLGISPMPSLGKARQAVLEQLSPQQEGTFLELGSGWGDLVLGMVARCPKLQVVAYEGAWVPWMVGWMRCRFSRYAERIAWKRCNFLKTTWPPSVQGVVCYLFPRAMRELAKELPLRLPAGTVVISHAFAIPGWKPERVVHLSDIFRTPVYVYRIPSLSEPT